MAVKKIAKIKQNNQKRNNFSKPSTSIGKKKGGKPSNAKNVKKVPRRTVPKINTAKQPEPEESEDGIEDMLEMVEDDDIEFLKSAITNRSYDFLNKVRYSQSPAKNKRRKLNTDDDDTLEQNYEDEIKEGEKVKSLLPIKTKDGIVRQTIVETSEETPSEAEDEKEENESIKEEDDDEDEEFIFEDDTVPKKTLSTAELLAARNEKLQKVKIEIGSLSASLLESPEERVSNLKTLLDIMNQYIPEVHLTIKKLATVSLLEVFKDLLPSYQIKPHINDGVKLKKDTLKLQKYEENLLLYYRKFLQKLEKYTSILRKRHGSGRARTDDELKLGELGVQCMCDLLTSHPNFNYSQNIAQAVVPFLNHHNKTVREMVKEACKTVFKEDKKQEITLKILRIINQHLKKHSHNVQLDMLEILLVLKIKDINLDRDKEQEIKEKKLLSHKQNILQMSKKEKKRKKRLQQLEKELLETKAEENKQSKQQNLTEITKIIFGIYFRVLKSSTNTKVLGICLEGLAKFAHCINLEYYIDIVNVLDNLLKQEWVGSREKLHCIQVVFSILSGQGEVLNLDPTQFYAGLYKEMLTIHASKTHQNFTALLHTLNSALIKRHKKITNKRTLGFIKRLTTLSLQLLHNSGLSCLGAVKIILQMNKAVDVLLDVDASTGDGKFQPEIEDPEYANAASTALYELVLLNRHYHPIVGRYARHIANGVPGTGEGSLPPQFGKCVPEQLHTDFDMSAMAFNPPVPVPKTTQPTGRSKQTRFVDSSFHQDCEKLRKKQNKSFYFDVSKLTIND